MTTKTSLHYKPTPDEYESLVTPKDRNNWVIKPRALEIIWGRDDRYWQIPEDKTGPVELRQVSWLQVTGSLDVRHLPEGRELIVKFYVKLKSDAFGWKNAPVYLMARVGKNYSWKKYDFSLLPKDTTVEVPQCPRVKVPGRAASGDGKLSFGMYEIWTGIWKGGLSIDKVVIEAI